MSLQRIILFANNELGLRVARWLVGRGNNVVCAVIHPPHRARLREEILEALRLDDWRVIDGDHLRGDVATEAIQRAKPEIGLSVLFGYLIRPPLLAAIPGGIVNLHTGYLPYNRGAYPNVWPIIEGTPAGVSLHYLDDGLDSGPVIDRRITPVLATDTGASLYRRLQDDAFDLLQEVWPRLEQGEALEARRYEGGTFHRVDDVGTVDEIDLQAPYRAADLINTIRARTFPPYPGSYFRDERGRRVFVRIQLETEGTSQDE